MAKFDPTLLENCDTVYANIANNVLIVNEDKVENRFMKYRVAVGSLYEWQAPTSLLSTAVVALITGNFTNDFIISHTQWQNIFQVLVFVSIIWLGVSLYHAYKNRGKTSVEYLINELKKDSVQYDNDNKSSQ